jgi:SAM-dependent methyltransferase
VAASGLEHPPVAAPTADPHEAYAAAYVADYGFEARMVAARRDAVLEWLTEATPASVLEVGCGIDSVASHRPDGLMGARWTIVEPVAAFAARAAADAGRDVRVIRGTVEQQTGELLALEPRGYDAIICSALVHEVPAPERLLASLGQLLAPAGVVHVDAPNPRSLHRRLAVELGLLDSLHAPTPRSAALGQRGPLGVDELAALVERSGLGVTQRGGIGLKPLSHAQMEAWLGGAGDTDPDALWRALCAVGRELPELAAEVFVRGRRPR